MATTREIVLRGPGSKTWPKTDLAAIAPRTSRRVEHLGCRWTVALSHDGRQMTGRVRGVEPLVRSDDWELPELSVADKREIVGKALDAL